MLDGKSKMNSDGFRPVVTSLLVAHNRLPLYSVLSCTKSKHGIGGDCTDATTSIDVRSTWMIMPTEGVPYLQACMRGSSGGPTSRG